jgi:hypothetical protein
VENSQDFEKFCQDGDRRWTTAGQVSFVDATHEMRKANDIQNAVDATKNSAAQLQHCQAGLSGLYPIILSKMTRHRLSGLSPIILFKMMTRHTKEITRIRKVVFNVVVLARATALASQSKPQRCVACSYVSTHMDQKTLKLDNLIEKMDPMDPKKKSYG